MKPSIELIDFHGIEAFRLRVGEGSATISRLGGQVLSWITSDGRERLYLSPQAVFDGSRPIRGGIPVCFPQFAGQGDLPKHGLLRTRPWQKDHQNTGDDFSLICLCVDSDASTTELWPHAWRAELTVMLEKDRLDIELAVINKGEQPFSFTGALHTYLRVTQVEDVALEGLEGLAYQDSADGGRLKRENSREVLIEAETDRIYLNAVRPVQLHAGNLSLAIEADGFPDVVVWNPWETLCSSFSDLPADGWRHMLCVEAAVAGKMAEVAPGEEWYGRQTLLAT